jgi:tRNA-(ms[2]io[6]A)-hydroxylase
LGPRRQDDYVVELFKLERKGGQRERQLMDKLLIAALIEARSCERFRLLSENISDLELRSFYRELMISEAGHYRTFINLAKEYMPEEEVLERWDEMLTKEGEILKKLEVRGDRVH